MDPAELPARVLRITGDVLDMASIERWAEILGVGELWREVRDRTGRREP